MGICPQGFCRPLVHAPSCQFGLRLMDQVQGYKTTKSEHLGILDPHQSFRKGRQAFLTSYSDFQCPSAFLCQIGCRLIHWELLYMLTLRPPTPELKVNGHYGYRYLQALSACKLPIWLKWIDQVQIYKTTKSDHFGTIDPHLSFCTGGRVFITSYSFFQCPSAPSCKIGYKLIHQLESCYMLTLRSHHILAKSQWVLWLGVYLQTLSSCTLLPIWAEIDGLSTDIFNGRM